MIVPWYLFKILEGDLVGILEKPTHSVRNFVNRAEMYWNNTDPEKFL